MIFCWCPNTLTVIWLMFNREGLILPYSVDFVVTLIAYFSCWINPLLFLILNRDYRVYVKKLFRLSKKRSTNDDYRFIKFNTATPETVEIYNTPQMDAKSQRNFHRKLCRQWSILPSYTHANRFSRCKTNATSMKSMNAQREKWKRRSRRWVLEKEIVTAGISSRNYKRIDENGKKSVAYVPRVMKKAFKSQVSLKDSIQWPLS